MISARFVAGSVVLGSLVLGCSSRPPSPREKASSPEVAADAAATTHPSIAAEPIDPLTQPSLVTLHFKKAPAGEVYRSLFDQAHATIEMWPPDLFDDGFRGGPGDSIPPVTIDVEKAPFWQVFRELEDQTGIDVNDFANEMRLSTFATGRGSRGKACITGPFMVVADERSIGPTIDGVRVFVEPRIRVLSHARVPNITTAVDINGEPVAVAAGDAAQGPPPRNRVAAAAAMRERSFELDERAGNAFSLQLPTPVPRTGRLAGTVRVVVAADEQVVEITDLPPGNDAEVEVNGERYLLTALNPERNDWLIHLTMFGHKAVHGAPQLSPALLDADGRAFKTQVRQGSASREGRLDVHWYFDQDPQCGRPVRLTFIRDERKIELPIAAAKVAERNMNGQRFVVSLLNPEAQEWIATVIAFDTFRPTPGFGDFDPVLLDAKGNALSLNGKAGGGGFPGSGRSDLELTFRQGPNGGPPAKLVLRLPKGTRDVEIPFSFGREPTKPGT